MRTQSPLFLTSLAALILTGIALAPAPATAGETDRIAPAFAVRTLDGKTFRLQDHRGKAVVLDFWATWCGPCRASMPHLNHLQERYTNEGLVVLGLSVDEQPPASVKRFTDRMGVKFRMAMADEKLMDQYGPIRLLPTTFFINRRGLVVRRTVGYLDAETLDSYVQELFE